MCGLSDGLLHVPHEGAEAEALGLFVDAVQLFEQRVYLLVAYYSEDGRAHGGPCVTAVVGLAGLAATSLYLGEHGESATVEVVEREEYLLLVCLVVGDKYGFHVFYLLFTNLLLALNHRVLMLSPVCIESKLAAVLAATALETDTCKHTVEYWHKHEGEDSRYGETTDNRYT